MKEKIQNFFKEVRQEWRHVNWPTRAEAMYLTGVVITISIALAVFLGLFDFIYLQLLEKLVLHI